MVKITRYALRHKLYLLFLVLFFSFLLLSTANVAADGKISIDFFYSPSCSDCQEKKPIIADIEQQYADSVVVTRKNIFSDEHPEYWDQWLQYNFTEIPSVVINNKTKIPKTDITTEELTTIIEQYLTGEEPNIAENQTDKLQFDFFGFKFSYDPTTFSLPINAMVIGLVDSFNPCSFFVLLFLLNLLIYVRSRRRMFLIGGIFIFFSGFLYFLFMLALLSMFYGIFAVSSQTVLISRIAGVIALILGVINIKDFFFFKKGFSLGIPEDKKPTLFEKMRDIVKSQYLPAMILGTVVLAVTANTYELFCTLELPLVFTNLLTSAQIPFFESLFLLFLYNLMYVIPLIVIVAVITMRLSQQKLSEWQGRVLKLFSGVMVGMLGLLLLVNPLLLRNVFSVIIILMVSVVISGVLSSLWKYFGLNNGN